MEKKRMNQKYFEIAGMALALTVGSSLASADGGKLLLSSELDSINAGFALAAAFGQAASVGPIAPSLAATQTGAQSFIIGGTGSAGAGAGAGAGGNAQANGAGAAVAATPFGTSGGVSGTVSVGGVTVGASVAGATGVYLP